MFWYFVSTSSSAPRDSFSSGNEVDLLRSFSHDEFLESGVCCTHRPQRSMKLKKSIYEKKGKRKSARCLLGHLKNIRIPTKINFQKPPRAALSPMLLGHLKNIRIPTKK
jgi:hypothetical protein